MSAEKLDSGDSSKSKGNQKQRMQILDNFGRNLTRLAFLGELEEAIGREDEIERLIQILTRKTKNNPVLVGEPGTGKSILVETLAIKIANNQVSRILQDKIIYQLDLTSIVAGTKYRGQFEERMKVIVEEIEKDPNIIVFIDEIHTIVGTGNSSGALDVSNILKPALSRGKLQCIGATTIDEYKKYIETDHALERRFQKILIKPSTKEQTKEIIMKSKSRYEVHHMVDYTEESINACVELADRYISNRFFPDKALDVLDEVGSRVHIKNIIVPKYILDAEQELVEIKAQKKQAVDGQDFEKAALHRDAEKKIQSKLEELKTQWKQESISNKIKVTEDDVYETVAKMVGIPIAKLSTDESERLIKMPEVLKTKIIGQDGAVEKVCESIQRARAGVDNPNKPIGSFLFLGQTGVGKTELAKTIGEYLFGTKDSVIKLDMSEYMEKHSVSRIIGAPAGYVGYEEGGMLADKVKNNPYCVVLFDEIEKAHPDVLNILLQILDDGKMTDGLGREINFKNTVIIMTSNAGTAEMNVKGKVGFKDENKQGDYTNENIIKNALTKYFRIEFLNRIDEQIIFRKLSKEDVKKIVKIKLNNINDVLYQKKIVLSFTDDLVNFIAEYSFDENYGARPILRAISKEIQTPLSQKVLKKEIVDGMNVEVGYDTKEKLVTFSVIENKKEEPETKKEEKKKRASKK
jgi:ATP-dependent Clp protease ATP-binding subunit ClpC